MKKHRLLTINAWSYLEKIKSCENTSWKVLKSHVTQFRCNIRFWPIEHWPDGSLFNAEHWPWVTVQILKSDTESLFIADNWPRGHISLSKVLEHDKTNKITCIRSLIRDFAVSTKKPWALGYPYTVQRRLIWLGGCPGWSESSLGAQVILMVLSWSGSKFDQWSIY